MNDNKETRKSRSTFMLVIGIAVMAMLYVAGTHTGFLSVASVVGALFLTIMAAVSWKKIK